MFAWWLACAPVSVEGGVDTGDADDDGYYADDCDDDNPLAHPEATERCDGLDNDCDGETDEAGAQGELTWYRDADGDGWGTTESTIEACEVRDGFAADLGDCDDEAADVHPGAEETCDGRDQDCDGVVDDGDVEGGSTWYQDRDDDGFGEDATATTSCGEPGPDWTEQGGDCDDDHPDANPDEDEQCNDGVDNDCDGTLNGCALAGELVLSEAADETLLGEASHTRAGSALATGEVNGDGDADLIVGADDLDDGATGDVGGIYTLRGPVDDGGDLADRGSTHRGVEEDGAAGAAVASGADVDGDGLHDVLIGAPGAASAYLLLGPPTAERLSDADASWSGTGELGSAVALVSDGTSDGYAELVVGAPTAGHGGEVQIIEGGTTPGDALVTITAEDDDDAFGAAVVGLPDTDGDGLAELLVGAPAHRAGGDDAGAVYRFGASYGTAVLASDADLKLAGVAGDGAGWGLAGGDLNGDGYADVLAGAPGADEGEADAGAVYVFHGPTDGAYYLSAADATLLGQRAYSYAGSSLAVVPDQSGDGLPDLAVGSPDADENGAGSGTIWLVSGPVEGSTSLEDAAALVLHGDGGAYAGQALAGGLLDDDATGDLAVGAHRDGSAGTEAGAVFLVFGLAL